MNPMVCGALPLLLSVGVFARPSISWQGDVAAAFKGESKTFAIEDLPDSYRGVWLSTGTDPFGGYLGIITLGMYSGAGRHAKERMMADLLKVEFVQPEEFAQLINGSVTRIRAYVVSLDKFSGQGSDREVPRPTFCEVWIEGGKVAQLSPRPEVNRASLLKICPKEDSASMGEERARTETLSRAKQLLIGATLYATDHDDRFRWSTRPLQLETRSILTLRTWSYGRVPIRKVDAYCITPISPRR